jgi:hypothetical protein
MNFDYKPNQRIIMADSSMLQIRLKVNRKFNRYSVFELYRQYLEKGNIEIDDATLSKSQVKRVVETGEKNKEQYQQYIKGLNKQDSPSNEAEPDSATPTPSSPTTEAFILPVPSIPPIPPLPAVQNFLSQEHPREQEKKEDQQPPQQEEPDRGIVFWSSRTPEDKAAYVKSLMDALDELEASGVLEQWQNECPEPDPYPKSTPITDAIASLDPNVPITWDEFFARIDSADN